MKIYAKEVLDKQEHPEVAPVINSESEVLEEVIKIEEPEVVDVVPDEWVIKVGEQWFKLLCPFTLVESRSDAAILTADVARAQAHRIVRIKKMACSIEKL